MSHDMNSSLWRPFTQMKLAAPPPRVVGSRGAKLFLENGQELIDAISSWWVITHGHCHPQVVQAVQRQLEQVDQVLFGNFSHEPAEQLIESLQELLPSSLKHFFFSDNGSTAVEVSLKMALQACQQKGEATRNRFVAFKQAYHGDTAGAMSVGGPSLFTQPYKEMLFDVIHVEQGTKSTAPWTSYVDDLKNQMEEHGSRVAALIVEPLIQGAGGMIMWPPQALSEVVQVARKHGAYVIFDEVMTGFGRTGRNFAMDHIDEKPDIICLSKGLTGGFLPLSLTIATPEVYQCFLDEEKSKMLFHGHSFTANPIACAAATASTQLMKDHVLKSKWEQIHHIHMKNIAPYRSHPCVVDTRVCGTVAAIELASDQRGYESPFSQIITQRAMEEGVFLRPLGNILYVLPPYCITPEELTQVWAVIGRLLEDSFLKNFSLDSFNP